MRILFVTHYFFPEGNAPATRVYELARRWVGDGHDVTVITGAPNVPAGVVYEGYANRWLDREDVAGVDTVRVWTYLAANKGTAKRILNYLSFMVTATLAGIRTPRPDLVIATSPQFFCGWAGVFLSRLRRVPLVLEIRDIWPESIVTVGAIGNRGVIRILEWLERAMYRAAERIVTVGEGYQRELEERGVPANRISVIPNGVDGRVFSPKGPDAGGIREEFELGDAFVCAYVGTIGLGCGLDVVLRAARQLREAGRDGIVFLLVGDGAVREELAAEARRDGLLGRVVFTGRQDKSRIPDFLAAADACLVHLARRDLFRSVMPSKIFEAAAMARPIVLGVEGHAADIVRDASAGICIEPDNEDDLVSAVEKLRGDSGLAKRLGASGHARIAARFDYDRLANDYLHLIDASHGADDSADTTP